MATFFATEALAPKVKGVIVLNGQHFAVELYSEMLFIDARTWFTHQHWKHIALAEDALKDGDESFGREMQEVADQIASLIERKWRVRVPSLWPQIYNRSVIEPWSVDDTPPARNAFGRTLVEFGTSSTSDNPSFLMLCEDGELIVTDRLRAQARFAAPFRSTIVELAAIMRRLEEIS